MSRPGDKQFTVLGMHLGQTEKAVKFRIEKINGTALDKKKEEWFPISQLTKIHRCPATSNDPDYLMASEWILKQKGYEEYLKVSGVHVMDDASFPDDPDNFDDDIPF